MQLLPFWRRDMVRWLSCWCVLLMVLVLSGAARANSVRVMSVSGNHLVSCLQTGRLYTVGTGDLSGSIVPIVPTTGVTETPIPVGGNMTCLAVSPNNKVLYAGLSTPNADGEAEIVRVLLNDGIVAGNHITRFSIGKGAAGEALFATDITVNPGNPDLLAVVRSTASGAPYDVSVYDSGVRRARGTDGNNKCTDVEFRASGTWPYLYGINGNGVLRVMTLDSGGVTVNRSTTGVFVGSQKIEVGFGSETNYGAFVYGSSGRVVGSNQSWEELRFTLPAGVVLPDILSERVYVLSPSGAGDNAHILRAFSPSSYRFMGELKIENVNGAPGNLVRWGTDGLAFRTSGGQIYLVQTSLVRAQTVSPSPLSVSNPAPGVRTLKLPVNDLIYDATRDRIWMSVPQSGWENGNSLISFDPATNAFSYPAWIGSNPNKLARSTDGQYLYCGLDGSASVAKFWLSSGQGGTTFSLGRNSNGPIFSQDIKVVPGQPDSVAVAGESRGVSTQLTGVAIYDGTQKRPNQVVQGSRSITFGATTSRLYGADTSAGGLHKMTVSTGGVSNDKSVAGLVNDNIVYSQSLLYLPNGRIVDPELERISGQLDVVFPGELGMGVIPDPGNNRIYYLTWAIGSTQAKIRAFSLSPRQPLGTYTVEGVEGGFPQSFIRWSPNGFAFRTAGEQVFFVQASQFSNAAPTITIFAPTDQSAYRTSPRSLGQIHDDSAIARVDISVLRQSDNLYWSPNGWTTEEALLQAKLEMASSGNSGTWYADNVFPSGILLNEGQYILKVYGHDYNGNVGTAQSTFTVERVPPSGTITVPVHNSVVTTFREIRGTATDSGSGVSTVQFGLFLNDGLWWNGTAWVSGTQWLKTEADGDTWKLAVSLPTGANLADGAYNVVQRVIDKAGNIYQTPGSQVTRFSLDSSSPVSQLIYLSGTPATGWYRGQTLVRIQATDNGSGVAKIMYSLDDAEPVVFVPGNYLNIAGNGVHTLRYWAVDNAGNEEAARTHEIKIDGVAPSGVITQPTANSTSQSFPAIHGTAFDEHSGIGTVQFGITRNDGLWWNGTAWVTGQQWLNATADGTEWVLNSNLPTGADLRTSFYHITQRVLDVAGNEYRTPFEIRTQLYVDNSAPVTTVLLNGSAPLNKWYRGMVQATLRASDQGSGPDKILYSLDGGATQEYSFGQHVLVEGSAVHTLRFWAVDKAGNEETPRELEIKIDAALPSGTITQPTANSVWQSFPAIHGTANDALSGVEAVQFGIIRYDGLWWNGTTWVTGQQWLSATAEGDEWVLNSGLPTGADLPTSSYRIAQRVLDMAGNEYRTPSAEWRQFYIDAAAPVSFVALQGPTPVNGWYGGTVQAWLRATDRGSGVDKIYYSLDGGATQVIFPTQPQAVFIQGDAIHTLKFWAVDKIGNEETSQSMEVKIDTVRPAIEWQGYATEPNAAGWYKEAVEARFNATDTTSGVASLHPESPLSIGQEGRNVTRGITATDHAGWEALFNTPSINIDLTAPKTTSSVDGVVSSNGTYLGVARITLIPTDSLSGVQSTFYAIDGGEAKLYSAPFEISGDGEHVVEFWSVDKAGNVEGEQRLELTIDSAPPQTIVDIDGTVGDNDWYRGTVTVTLSVQETGAVTYFRLGTGDAHVYQGPLTISNDGKHVIEFYSVDKAGNAEAKQTLNINIDSQNPSLTWGTPSPAPNADGWNNTDVEIPFTISDVTSGVASASQPSPLTLNSEGKEQGKTVTVHDKAGNSALFSSPRVNLDFTAPQTSAAVNGTVGSNGWLRSTATVTLNGSDALSGVQSTLARINGGAAQTYSAPLSLSSGTHTLLFWSVDKAGNTEAAKSQAVKVDAALPTLTIAATPTSVKSTGKPLTVQVSGKLSDTLSGIDLTGASYSVVDEYNRSKPSGAVTIAGDGTYRFSVTLEGNAEKRDSNGRLYTITTRGRDLAGNPATASVNVIVK